MIRWDPDYQPCQHPMYGWANGPLTRCGKPAVAKEGLMLDEPVCREHAHTWAIPLDAEREAPEPPKRGW